MNGLWPLSIAAKEGKLKVVKYLLQKLGESIVSDVDTVIDELGNTPLHYIVRTIVTENKSVSKLVTVMELLIHHLNPFIPDIINFQNQIGETPLHEACFQGNATAVDFLLKHVGKMGVLTINNESIFHYIIRRQGPISLFVTLMCFDDTALNIELLKIRGIEGDCIEMAEKYSYESRDYSKCIKAFINRHKRLKGETTYVYTIKKKEYMIVEDLFPRFVWTKIFHNLLSYDLCSISFVCKLFYSLARDQELWIDVTRIGIHIMDHFKIPNTFLPQPKYIIPELFYANTDQRKKLFKAKAFSDYLTKLSQENLKPTTTSKKKMENIQSSQFQALLHPFRHRSS